MPSGWLWEIDHADGCGIGYVYSAAFATQEVALQELERVIGPFRDHRIIRFDPGARRRHWVGNVVSIGNSDGFIEPLEATTLSIILCCAIDVAEMLATDIDRTDLIRLYNANVDRLFTNVRDFILMHFVFNERLDTEYWRACRRLQNAITKDSISEFLLNYYRRNGPCLKFVGGIYSKYNFFGLEGYYTLFKGLGIETQVDDVLARTYLPGT
jgi:tryptophan halogenase